MYKILIISSLFIVFSCKHDPFPYDAPPIAPPDTTNPILPKNCDDSAYFNPTVLNLINSSCAHVGCHDTERDSTDKIVLTDYISIMTSKNGDLIDVGDASESKLYKVLIEADADDRMPPPQSPPLTAEEIALIAQWINEDAKDNTCYDCDTIDFKFSTHIMPVVQNSCVKCHGDIPTGTAKYSLRNYAEVKFGVDTNDLIKRISHIVGYKPMPYSQTNPGALKLDSCTIRAFEIWEFLKMPNN